MYLNENLKSSYYIMPATFLTLHLRVYDHYPLTLQPVSDLISLMISTQSPSFLPLLYFFLYNLQGQLGLVGKTHQIDNILYLLNIYMSDFNEFRIVELVELVCNTFWVPMIHFLKCYLILLEYFFQKDLNFLAWALVKNFLSGTYKNVGSFLKL